MAPLANATQTKRSILCELQEIYDSFHRDEIVFITGDVNSRVGSRKEQDSDGTREVVGPYGLGHRNENGERLINFCITNDLRIEHPFHQHKISQKASWYHPRFKSAGPIDTALVQRKHAKHAADLRVLLSADTLSDHRLCGMKLIQKPVQTWRNFNDKNKKHGANGRPSRLPVDMNNEEFAKAVDHALKELDDLEEAQRRIRSIAEECFHSDSQKGRPQWQKTTQSVSKNSRESDSKRWLSCNKDITKKRVGDTEAYVNKTGRPQDKCLQNGGTAVFMTWKLRQSTEIHAPYTRG